MAWWVADRGQTLDRESVRGQAANSLTPGGECNAGITKIKAQEGKGEPDVRLCVLTRRAIYVRVSVSTVAESFSGLAVQMPFWYDRPGALEHLPM